MNKLEIPKIKDDMIFELIRKNEDLQQENKQLKEEINQLEQVRYSLDRVELESRIEKAIEYIEEKGRLKYKPEELLEILGDKEK